MRPITTAIDKGEQKVPGEKHTAVRYALAPGEALRTDKVEESGAVKVTPDMARRAEYTWCTIWRENRVLAEFSVDGMLLAQPIKPDPQPKRRKDASEGHHRPADEGPRAASDSADQARVHVPDVQEAPRRRRAVPVALSDTEAPRKRSFRRPRVPPPDLL